MGQKTSWSKMFEGLGSSLVQSGLKKAEGTVAGMLGLGGSKPGESPAKPMWTKSVDGIAGVAGTGLGGLEKFGSSTPSRPWKFHCTSPALPRAAIPIRTRLPSLVRTDQSCSRRAAFAGHVTSNRDLRTMATAGGIVYQVGNINASGANQAEVEMRVQRGMVLAHNQAVKTSTQQLREQSLRRPSRTR